MLSDVCSVVGNFFELCRCCKIIGLRFSYEKMFVFKNIRLVLVQFNVLQVIVLIKLLVIVGRYSLGVVVFLG